MFHRTILRTSRQNTISRLAAFQSQLASPSPRTFTRAMASQIPKTMKGVIIEKNGGTEVLQYKTDLPVPQPKEGEVLVKNDFIGVNFIDTYFRSGLYKPPSFPYTLGREASGTIIATGSGDLHSLKTGDHVVYFGTSAYAEYTAAPALQTTIVPPDITSEVAAASLLQGITALTLIRESHSVKKGDWVLVHAAAGGVGLWLCQLLKAVGAHTIATASTPAKRELAKNYGAEVLIDYTSESVPEKVKAATNGAGAIAVFDGVGKTTFDDSLESIARKGTMVSYGNASGAPDPLVLQRLAAKNAKVQRPTLFNYIATREEFEHYSQELFKFIKDNNLDPRIHETYPLAEVARAHQDLEGRKTTGKLILKV